MNAITGYQSVGRVIPGMNIFEPGAWGSFAEPFDRAEVSGIDAHEPLLQIEALTDNDWYKTKMYPLIYELYPFDKSIGITWRKVDKVGVPPLRGMSITQDDTPELSSSDAIYQDVAPKQGRTIFNYSLSFYAYQDFFELRQKSFDKYLNNLSAAPAGAYRLMSTPYYDITKGALRFNLSYKLPGINKTTTIKTFAIDW